ncbi:Octanoyltransferase [Chlorella sorokiniana]|uniref:lipoyl(octanoyl) transferase n=1 Tax=Chlorella sorokiniana TaxID=3076 RepID=A0A2P6TJI5_CHLSO|nr:Octanoyltransferase [Chlorella sorokiniana]|eukprot:PRW44247.1 Octanoyltransferase [Chlorella sorokiniana]
MRRRDEIPDTLLQLEHSPVYTIGKRGSAADFRTAADALAAHGAEIVTIPRGGETTYHGPGQLVVYPIVSLRLLGVGARAYVEGLEDVLVRTLGRYGIAARGRVPGKTGVWVGERKIGAIGVRISQGVTSHGVALNVSTDLSAFQHIVPCGTPDKEVTSIHRQLAAGQQWAHQGQQQASQQEQPGEQREQQQPAAPGMAGLAAAAASSLQAPSLQQVADCFLDDFAAHFGFTQFEPLPDVCQLAAELGCCNTSTS